MGASNRGGSGVRRLAAGYVGLACGFAVLSILSFRAGSHRRPAITVDGEYALVEESPCLGQSGDLFTLTQSGRFLTLSGSQGSGGKLELSDRTIAGRVRCRDGSSLSIALRVGQVNASAGAPSRTLTGNEIRAQSHPPSPQKEAAATPLTPEATFGRLMLAIAVVILAARSLGLIVGKIRQPHVMGEVLAGILLGPTLLGALAPGVAGYVFPSQIVPLLGGAADIGLVFYMFLVGLELDPRVLRGRLAEAAFISNASVLLPLGLGFAAAVPLYSLVGPAKPFAAFALFMGVAMSITAFPVLARILLERRMIRRPLGAMAIACAAVDDVTAWGLLALASAVARKGTLGLSAARVLGLAVAFCAAMGLIGRRVLARVSDAYDEAGQVPAGWIAAIFVGVLLSAYVSTLIGIAAIFGAFVMGLIMPRRADLSADVTRRIENFVATLLLPLFFVVTGLRTQLGLLDRPELWLLTAALLGVAVLGKFAGATAASWFVRNPLRESAAIGALMNTRGLTELIVLNIGLDLHVITPALFTMLVLMALITTFSTGPAMSLIDRRGEFSAPLEEELPALEPERGRRAERLPERSILVAPQSVRSLDPLLTLAEPLTLSEPPRELLLAMLVRPSRVATLMATDDRRLAEASEALEERRQGMLERGIAARAAAFTSADIGGDLLRLASQDNVDLVLVNGRRPLMGGGVPGGPVGLLLEKAPCDVAVLVEQRKAPPIDSEHPILVPFGGTDHDWAALELAAWIASRQKARLRLLGRKADPGEGKRDASRLLASASLVVQRLAGIAAEPLLIDPGRDEIIRVSRGASLIVVGLSSRWREEGLGPVRAQIARMAPAPTLFVRRGLRPGALSPSDDATRFTWSTIGPPAVPPPPGDGMGTR